MKKLITFLTALLGGCLLSFEPALAKAPPRAWQKTFGGKDQECGYCIQETNDAGYIIVGKTKSLGAGDDDVYLIKTDSGGNKIWEKTFGGAKPDCGNSVRQTSDGGYIIAGRTASFGAVWYDVYLIKTDSKGNMLWQKTFHAGIDEEANSVQQTTDGGYIIAGETSSKRGDYDVYLIKTDPKGNMLWERTHGGFDTESGNSVHQTTDGGYVIAGATYSFGAGRSDVYLIKADSAGHMLWRKTFGGSSHDWARSVQQTTDGGYIIAGRTYSFGAGDDDVYLIKTDSAGDKDWEKTFGGSEHDSGNSVRQTTDGGYIIVGETESLGAGGNDVYLVKTDSGGNKEWEKTFGGTKGEGGSSVQQTSDGGYIITGVTDSFGVGDDDVYLIKIASTGPTPAGDQPGNWQKTFAGKDRDRGYCVQQTTDGGYIIVGKTKSLGAGDDDVYVIKTDSAGNMSWKKTFGGSESDVGNSVQQTTDGGYIIAGGTASFATVWQDVYLIKTDTTGNRLWEKTFHAGVEDQANSVQQTTDGGYIIIGKTRAPRAEDDDVYLVKTDSAGNKKWEKTFVGSRSDVGNSVEQTSDGGYIIVGKSNSLGAGDDDVYLIKTDSTGNKEWEKTFGGNRSDVGNSVQQTTDGGYIITGWTYSFGAGDYDVYLIKTDSAGNKKWEKTFGGVEHDSGNSVRQTTDGGYVIAGSRSHDVYLVKTDADGNKEWQKTFGGSQSDAGCSVQQTVDGGYIITGVSDSFGAGDDDVYLIKVGTRDSD
ncbi:MAG: hypothetical protein HWN69_09465 [Desulfobacterales bacterium]|nr:hypothetical protein [Desulfobacterales bacterium]